MCIFPPTSAGLFVWQPVSGLLRGNKEIKEGFVMTLNDLRSNGLETDNVVG